MSLLFYIENFVVVGRTYPLIYTEEKEKGKTLFVEILLIGVGLAMAKLLYQFIKLKELKIANYAIGRIDIRNTVLKEYYLH